jgi:hypothetical protein
MNIKKIVSNVLQEAVSKKDFPNIVRQKLLDAYPTSFNQLTPEEQEQYINQIITRHDVLKPILNTDNSIVYNFLLRHDGTHGSKKVELQQLQSLPEAPIEELLDLMTLLSKGKFEKKELSVSTVDEPEKSDEEKEKERVDAIFKNNSNKPTDEKMEYSKSMWMDEGSALVNENGVRVYYIKDQETSERFGYYYESIFKQQWQIVIGDKQYANVPLRAPWCQIWRGEASYSYPVKDDNGNLLYSHSPNKWGQMREQHGYTFYYLIDDKINPLENVVDKGQWHMVAIAIKRNGGIILSPMLNAGELSKQWDSVVQMYPELAKHRNIFQSEEFEESELKRRLDDKNTIKVSENEGSPKEFARLSPDEQITWIQQDNDITKVKSWRAMAPPVRLAYIGTIDASNYTHKISNWDLLKAILSTEGFANKINRRVPNGVTKLVDFYINIDFNVAFSGKKTETIIVLSEKRSKRIGIFDKLKGNWVESGGITYSDKFINQDRNGDIVVTNDGDYILVYHFASDDGNSFYIVNDEPQSTPHIGYILSEKSYMSFRDEFLNDSTKFDPSGKQVDIGEISL